MLEHPASSAPAARQAYSNSFLGRADGAARQQARGRERAQPRRQRLGAGARRRRGALLKGRDAACHRGRSTGDVACHFRHLPTKAAQWRSSTPATRTRGERPRGRQGAWLPAQPLNLELGVVTMRRRQPRRPRLRVSGGAHRWRSPRGHRGLPDHPLRTARAATGDRADFPVRALRHRARGRLGGDRQALPALGPAARRAARRLAFGDFSVRAELPTMRRSSCVNTPAPSTR